MKYKKTSLLAVVLALVLTLGMATGFTTGAVAKESDSALPSGQPTASEGSNQEAGLQDTDSTLGGLASVNRGDERKFTPEEWAEILKKVEAGEILLFETAEEERAFWADEDNATLKDSLLSKGSDGVKWKYLPIIESILAGEVEADTMLGDGAEYQVKLVEGNGMEYQWISVSEVS